MLKRLTAFIYTGCFGFLLIQLPGHAFAQLQPNASVKVPNATGTVTTPHKGEENTSGTQVNFIRTWQPQQRYNDATAVIDAARTADEVSKGTEYLDGLGRPLQSVSWQSSPSKKDIVSPVEYDAFGREQYKYLPYASSSNTGDFAITPFSSQAAFYTGSYKTEQPAFNNEQFFYSHTQFEASPLNRVQASFAPGNSWAGSEGAATERAVKMEYLINTTSDKVRIWDIGFETPVADDKNIPVSASGKEYAAGTLYKTVTKDEHGNAVVEYKDTEGHIILKKVQIGTINADYSGYPGWLCTYYVYDDFGQLRIVIPPKAVAQITSTWVLTLTIVNELCFRYEYDDRQRMIAKKVPGAGWVYMVYDSRDRLVFTQDANMLSKLPKQWMYTLYDEINRPVETGIMTYSGSWASLTDAVKALSSSAPASNSQSGTYVPVYADDLFINSREIGRQEYKATQSITFDQGFESEDGAQFTAEIVSDTANTFSTTVTVIASPKTIGGTGFYPLTYTYYDNYSDYATTKSYSATNNAKLDGGTNIAGTLESLPSQNSNQTEGMVTITRVRAIEDPNNLASGKWMEAVNFYDDKGRLIQVQADNYKGGKDIITTRYNFLNKPVCTYTVHSNASANSNVSVKTNFNYDHAGRVTTIVKQLNDIAVTKRTIIQNQYDALGQLKNKKIGQKSYTDTNPMETDDYAYNIRGWLKGINWDYSGASNTKPQTAADKWFAMDLSYDWGYNNGAAATGQYNGNIAGIRWIADGDGKERSYGFGYDKANRLLKGDFLQNDAGWNLSANINYSMLMGNDGSDVASAYDENGNIIKMQQYGLMFGSTSISSGIIDNLSYSYFNSGNKLQKVTDAVTADNKLGDFIDKNTGDDYGYDVNGNLLTDKNKRLNGSTGEDIAVTAGAIQYNHLNLPWKITVKDDAGNDKGTITYIYDAVGNKLEKRTQELASAANGYAEKNKATTYLGSYVYENNKLQYMAHEEGRIRPIVPAADNGSQSFAYDYFLKDHLGNVRTVLTDEGKQDVYPVADVESQNAAALSIEKQYYDIQDANIIDESSIVAFNGTTTNEYQNNNGNPPYNNNPSANTGDNSTKLYKLNGKNGVKTGLGITLKVMTGDKVDVFGKSFYHLNSGQTPDNSYLITTTLLSFLNTFAGSAAVSATHTGVTGSTLNESPQITNPLNSWLNGSQHAPPGSTPKAYINWVFLDDQFNPVTTGMSGATRVSDANNTLKAHTATVNISKNGYLYVYCSNESDVDVFFDNLQLVHTRGPLLEETQYYPFGLLMSGISFSALNFGNPTNKIKFGGKELQSNEFSDNSGLELYDFAARNYDPQIGRWWSNDPKADKSVWISPYNYCLNNPIKFFDPDGKLPWPVHVRSFISTPTTGGLFRGDGRGPSTSANPIISSSRVRSTFTVDPTKGTITKPDAKSDPTVFYGAGMPGMPGYLPPKVDVGKPTASITNQKISKDDISLDFSHSGKDPITPQAVTPALDVHASLNFKEDDKKGTLTISGSFTGDQFPSTEAFITDQSGKTQLFLGAQKEDGGVMDLYGDNKESLFSVNIVVTFDAKGNFTGVKQGDQAYTVAEWNKKVQDQFNQYSGKNLSSKSTEAQALVINAFYFFAT